MADTTSQRVEKSAERMFQRSGRTEFPTIARVAKALGLTVAEVDEAVEENENLCSTYWHVVGYADVPDGKRFVEVIGAPEGET